MPQPYVNVGGRPPTPIKRLRRKDRSWQVAIPSNLVRALAWPRGQLLYVALHDNGTLLITPLTPQHATDALRPTADR